jgi:hypothetical protein
LSRADSAGERAVRAAIDAGFTLFDHADIYGGGACEEIFGAVMKESPALERLPAFDPLRDHPRFASILASAAEGHRAALEIYLRSDAARPSFVPIVGPTFKWGGDNSDAFYNFAPVAPDVEYRVQGKRGDAVYISVCIYGGPDDGRWSTRIVSNLNDRDIDFACRIDAFTPYRFPVFEKRNHEPRYQDGVVRVHVQFDQETVRMVIAGPVLQHMPGGDQVQPGVAFEKETRGIGFLFLVQHGRDAGHGQQQ